MDVPKSYQYYPKVPLSDLSDLYSVGDNELDGKKVCIISYLPKVLRIGAELPVTNKYALFIEDTATVASVVWSVKLYNKGLLKDNPSELQVFGQNTNDFLIFIDPGFYESSGANIGDLLFDRMIITCVVTGNTGNSKTISIEHLFSKMFDFVKMLEANDISPSTLNIPFVSNTDVTNYIYNSINDYITEEKLTWNRLDVLSNTREQENLLNIVIGIMYFNILRAISSDFDFCVDIDEFENKRIKSYLNNTPKPEYDGGYRNGITELPLYLLNEILNGDVTRLPDFTNIANSDKLYEMLSVHESTCIIERILSWIFDNDDGIPDLLSDLVKASKKRLHDDEDRLIELYNLSMFPKSCIKLTAIFVKYLFECSKKNNCNDCFGKEDGWESISMDLIDQHKNFAKSLLVHYLRGPDNKITKIPPYIDNVIDHIWSIHVYMSVHIAPRIVTAYFAKKVVKHDELGSNLTCHFERLDNQQIRVGSDELALADQPDFDALLGSQIYLVVETLNCRDKELQCTVRPFDNTLTGNQNDLELVRGPDTWNPAPVFNNETVMSVTVGSANSINNIDGNHEHYINVHDDVVSGKYNVDHLDKAIIKLNIRPSTLAVFNTWANNLSVHNGNAADQLPTLMITVKTAVTGETFYGNNTELKEDAGEFLNANDTYNPNARFRLVNRIAFDIFSPGNEYSFLSMNGGTRRRIGRIENVFTNSIQNANAAHLPFRIANYTYHDDFDNQHDFGEFPITKTQRHIDANTLSAVAGDLINLIEATTLNAYNNDGVSLAFMTDNSDRDFIDLDCFAGLMGAMADNNIVDLGFNGFSSSTGGSAPSRSHINGVAGDLRYLRLAADGQTCWLRTTQVWNSAMSADFDYDRQVTFNNSLFDYGWGRTSNMLSENFPRLGATTLLPHCNHFHQAQIGGAYVNTRTIMNAGVLSEEVLATGVIVAQAGLNLSVHYHHLHVQGFDRTNDGTVDSATIQVINL